jgi:hypothetical protein
MPVAPDGGILVINGQGVAVLNGVGTGVVANGAPSSYRCDFSGPLGPEWLTVDTEAKITVAGGSLVFAGGKAAPAHGDPMEQLKIPWTRVAGLTFEAKVQAGGTAGYGPYLIVANAIPYTTPASMQEYEIILGASASVRTNRLNSPIVLPPTYSAATWYWFRIRLLATGAQVEFSYDNVTYYRLWNYTPGTTATLYAAIQTYSQAGSVSRPFRVYQLPVPAPLVSATPAAVTPATTGGELLTNVEFTTNTTNWTATGPTETRRDYATAPDIDPTGGTDNYGMEAASNGADGYVAQSLAAPSAGTWYRVSTRAYSPSANTGVRPTRLQVYTAAASAFSVQISAEDAWETLIGVARHISGAFQVRLRNASATAGDLSHYDAPSTQSLTLASLHSLAGDAGRKAGLFEAPLTIVAGTQAGIAVCLDNEANPAYELLAYCDRTNVVLVNRVNNVEGAALISTATSVVYADGAKLRIVIVPVAGSANSSVAVYYGATLVQIGTTQTVDLSAHGTKVAAFSTSAANTVGLVEAHA